MYSTPRNLDVAPWLPEMAQVGVVGQSVGPQELRRGRPFTGPAGRQLRGWLVAVGLDPDLDVAYTNIEMRFHPEAPNYEPTKQEIKAAQPRIIEELGLCPSMKVVVLTGIPACRLLFKGSMTAMSGRIGKLDRWPAVACPHPSAYLRARGYKEKAEWEGRVLGSLKAAKAIVTGQEVEYFLPPYTEVEGIVVC